MGLFALSSFMAERRTKEIGVRKILGATVSGIVRMLTKELIYLVITANFIAMPVGYFLMKMWLSSFAYKIGMGPLIVLLVGLMTVVVSLLTVSFQSAKAAAANPVDSLRNE